MLSVLSSHMASTNTFFANLSNTPLDYLWVMVAVIIVFMMKGGVLLYEAGMVRAKNTINTAQKNLTDTLMSIIIFYMFGYNVMFAESIGGMFGWNWDLLFHEKNHIFFLYQITFCGMAASIISGALAERIDFDAYIVTVLFVTGIVYPVFGHWVWGNAILPENDVFLASKGFIDFAGGVVVSCIGGWAALAGVIVLGPRLGKFGENGKVNDMPASNIVLSSFGVMLIWVGALAFNTALAQAGTSEAAHVMSNTLLSAACSGTVALYLGRFMDGFYHPKRCLHGILAGLSGIASGCILYDPYEAAFVGMMCGAIVVIGYRIMYHRFQLDDIVCAVPSHALAGAFGALMIGPLGYIELFGGHTRLEQFLVQVQGVAISFLWSFGVMFVFFLVLRRYFTLRVPSEDEIMGLNRAEHGVTMGTGALQEALSNVVSGRGDLTQRLDETTGDEAAEIAVLFNKFMERMQFLMLNIGQNSNVLAAASGRLSDISTRFSGGFEKILGDSDDIRSNTVSVAGDVQAASSVTDEMKRQISGISNSAQDMSRELMEVAHTLRSMTSDINSVASSAASARSTVSRANHFMGDVGTTTQKLVQTVENIGGVVDFIKNIAEETNLLALNASVEAARAGEVGRGFAVVAEQIKGLAGQTSESAKHITKQIQAVQQGSGDVNKMISGIAEVIDTIEREVSSISDRANKQSDASSNISESVNIATEHAGEVAKSIRNMEAGASALAEGMQRASSQTHATMESVQNYTAVAGKNRQNAQEVDKTATDLNAIASELSRIMNQYKV